MMGEKQGLDLILCAKGLQLCLSCIVELYELVQVLIGVSIHDID